MAFKQTLIHRMLSNICNTKSTTQTLRNCRISSSAALIPPNSNTLAPDPGDDTVLRRFFRPPELLRPKTPSVLEKLKQMDIARNRIHLDVLSPPVKRSPEPELTEADAKKIVRVLQIEKLKSELQRSGKNHVLYDEYVQMCVEVCSDRDLGLDLAKALDDSGDVIVLGNVVFLKPEQVVKAIYGLLPKNLSAAHNPPLKELEEMEQWKSAIDTKAKNLVQRELWGGLGYLVVQTAVFMRLTFWELDTNLGCPGPNQMGL